MYPFGETVTIVSTEVTGQDAYGGDILANVETDVPGCAFAPAGSPERVQGQDLVTTTPTVYLPTGADVPSPSDRVKVRGRAYDIDGEPLVFVNPYTGSQPGAVLRLKAVTG